VGLGERKWGADRVAFCKASLPNSVTGANTAALIVTFLKKGYIGITSTQETTLLE